MATNTQIPPTSQLNRNIFFCLRDKAKSGAVGHLMSVNPEDLTVASPSRLAVQQTMGGAWVDNFGPGLRTITISGNTGWRAKYNAGRDWAAEYASLHQEAFEGWHTQRALKVHAGNNPDDITMEFVDVLDKIAVVVAPIGFTLKRSRARPLLVQYNIVMNVLSDIGGYEFNAANLKHPIDPSLVEKSFSGGLDDLANSITTLTKTIDDAAGSFADKLKPAIAFLDSVNRLMNAVKGAIAAGLGYFQPLVSLAQKVAQTGQNIFSTLAAIASFPAKLAGVFSQITSVFRNFFCLLSNGFAKSLALPNFNDFYGASNCSSTTGGSPISPLRNLNGFSQLPSLG